MSVSPSNETVSSVHCLHNKCESCLTESNDCRWHSGQYCYDRNGFPHSDGAHSASQIYECPKVYITIGIVIATGIGLCLCMAIYFVFNCCGAKKQNAKRSTIDDYEDEYDENIYKQSKDVNRINSGNSDVHICYDAHDLGNHLMVRASMKDFQPSLEKVKEIELPLRHSSCKYTVDEEQSTLLSVTAGSYSQNSDAYLKSSKSLRPVKL